MINLFDFEIDQQINKGDVTLKKNTSINEKYEKGYSRVVTENGSYKVSLIRDTFTQANYNLHPEYQRRITWNNQKRSKLIESLIINIPIPPVFLYEYDYDKYEIMDGLQRISTIIDFYNNNFKLVGLEEWGELNGKYYKNLPEKIKEGIDRRQIQVTTLLKESANEFARADKIKRLVFERLNTGGVKLQGQEIRNAIFNGSGNQMCFKLSSILSFRLLWDIPTPTEETDSDDINEYESQQIQMYDDEKLRKKLERHSLYKRMYDVELVLRYFAMRRIDNFTYSLSDFLDDTLMSLNSYDDTQLALLETSFNNAIDCAEKLFGTKAFRFFDGEKWTSPIKMIYDPIMQVLSQQDLEIFQTDFSIDTNVENLKNFYIDNNEAFDGKHQSQEEIKKRMSLLNDLIRTL